MEKQNNSERVRTAIAFLENILELVKKLDEKEGYQDSYLLTDRYMEMAQELAERMHAIPDIDEALENFRQMYFVTDIIALLMVNEKKKREKAFDELISDSNGLTS